MKLCLLAAANSVHVQRWVEYFSNKGHEVHLISQKTSSLIDVENVNFYLLKRPFPRIWLISSLMNRVYILIQAKKLIKKINPDVLHAHYVSHNGIIGSFSNFHPFVVSVWGSDVLSDPDRSIIVRFFVSYTLKKADLVLTIPEFMKNHLIAKFKVPAANIVRIPWGIDLKVFYKGYEEEIHKLKKELCIKENSTIVLSNRTMAPQYGIENLIEAAYHVIKKHPNTTFLLMRGYGSPKFEDDMRLKVRELGLIDNIMFISKLVSSKKMAVYLNMADMFVSIPYTDQFASSIMEGMACGTIPIVGEVEAYNQYLSHGKNAFFVDSKDSIDIAKNISYSIEHPEIRLDFYKINRKIIETDEDWDKNAVIMEQFYKELVKKEM